MNLKKKIALFGYGGHAREVAIQIGRKVTHFVDDSHSDNISLPISKFDPDLYYMMIAVADPFQRETILRKLPSGTEYFTFVHPLAKVMDDKTIEIGEGSFIGANCILTTKKLILKILI